MGVCFAEQAFNKARRMETRERLNDHMVTYKDWQRILEAVKVSKQQEAGPGRAVTRVVVRYTAPPCRDFAGAAFCGRSTRQRFTAPAGGGAHTRTITCLF